MSSIKYVGEAVQPVQGMFDFEPENNMFPVAVGFVVDEDEDGMLLVSCVNESGTQSEIEVFEQDVVVLI